MCLEFIKSSLQVSEARVEIHAHRIHTLTNCFEVFEGGLLLKGEGWCRRWSGDGREWAEKDEKGLGRGGQRWCGVENTWVVWTRSHVLREGLRHGCRKVVAQLASRLQPVSSWRQGGADDFGG